MISLILFLTLFNFTFSQDIEEPLNELNTVLSDINKSLIKLESTLTKSNENIKDTENIIELTNENIKDLTLEFKDISNDFKDFKLELKDNVGFLFDILIVIAGVIILMIFCFTGVVYQLHELMSVKD